MQTSSSQSSCELTKACHEVYEGISPSKKMNSQVLSKCNNLCAFHLLNVYYPLAFTLRSFFAI